MAWRASQTISPTWSKTFSQRVRICFPQFSHRLHGFFRRGGNAGVANHQRKGCANAECFDGLAFDEIDRPGVCDNGIVNPGRRAVMEFFGFKSQLVHLFVWQGLAEECRKGPQDGNRYGRAGPESGCNRDGGLEIDRAGRRACDTQAGENAVDNGGQWMVRRELGECRGKIDIGSFDPDPAAANFRLPSRLPAPASPARPGPGARRRRHVRQTG